MPLGAGVGWVPGLGSGEASRGCGICLLHRELAGCRLEKYRGAQPRFRAGLLPAGGGSGRSHGEPGAGSLCRWPFSEFRR